MSYFTRASRRLHYQLLTCEDASAPLVVYIHGLLMDNLSSGYFTFAHRLRERAHVLLYDLFGHGRSDLEPEGYRPSDHIADLTGLITEVTRELGHSGAHESEVSAPPVLIIGCSYGGVLALKAARDIAQVKRVILLEGHLGHESFVRQLRADLSATGAEAESLLAQHFQHWFHRGSERKRRRLETRARRLIYESSLIADLEAEPLQLEEWLTPEALSFPINALYGEESDALTAARARILESPLKACAR